MRALHRMASIGTAVGSVPSPKNQCLNETPVPAVGKNFCTMVGRESWLLQFYRNAAILNFDLRLWMPALNDLTVCTEKSKSERIDDEVRPVWRAYL